MSDSRPQLVVDALKAHLKGHGDIDYGSFEVAAGEVALIRGASGSGKSTLLHLLAGVYPVLDASAAPVADTYGRGHVHIGDLALSGLSRAARDALRPRTVSWMPQRQLAISSLPVLDNVLLPIAFAASPAAADRARARGLLQALGVAEHATRLPSTLSVGQLARVCLARALVAQPRVLLVDEPTAALDAASSELVAGQLRQAAAHGMVVVVASHDAELQTLLTRDTATPLRVVELAR